MVDTRLSIVKQLLTRCWVWMENQEYAEINPFAIADLRWSGASLVVRAGSIGSHLRYRIGEHSRLSIPL
jgi:hypothetical protein